LATNFTVDYSTCCSNRYIQLFSEQIIAFSSNHVCWFYSSNSIRNFVWLAGYQFRPQACNICASL